MASREIVIQALTYGVGNEVGTDTIFRYGDMPEAYNVQCLMEDALTLLEAQENESVVRCKHCKYGKYTGTEWLCDKHSGHEDVFGEDKYYKEWHHGNYYCADGEWR